MNLRTDITGRPACILIVDDDRENRELLEIVLARDGFVTQSAASGEEALDAVGLRPPDLILLDVMMPGMDGYEVAQELKSKLATCNIPIILLSALDGREARMRGLRAGANDVLGKPVNRAELCLRVRSLLHLAS
jgi:diguanylate cyclase